MTKLTNGIRSAIRADLREHRFATQVKVLAAAAESFADKVYNTMYDEDTQAKMAALPEGWLPEDEGVYVCCLGQYHRVHFNGVTTSLDSALRNLVEYPPYTSRRFMQAHHDVAYSLKDQALLSSWEETVQETRRLYETYGRVNSELRAALDSFTTIEKLIEAWPEVEPFAKAYITNPKKVAKIQLPAVQVTSLNAMLDLPIEA